MGSEDAWLSHLWPVVAAHVPSTARSVLDVGCGPLGGFVPRLSARGHHALGIDPRAPEGPEYASVELEQHRPATGYDAVVACTSLHHVVALADAVAALAGLLSPTGTLVVIEWDWQRLDDTTAAWCFARTGPDQTWLSPLVEAWDSRRVTWAAALADWAGRQGIHSVGAIDRALSARFDVLAVGDGPYFFPDLPGIDAQTEQAAIDRDELRANAVYRVGRGRDC